MRLSANQDKTNSKKLGSDKRGNRIVKRYIRREIQETKKKCRFVGCTEALVLG